MLRLQVGNRDCEERNFSLLFVAENGCQGEPLRYLCQRQRCRDRSRQRDGASHRAHARETNSHGHPPTRQARPSQAPGNSVGQVAERFSEKLGGDIAPSDGGLSTHGLRTGKWRHYPLVDVDRQSRQFRSGLLAEQTSKDWAAYLGQLPDGVDARIVEATFCRRSDAPYQTDRKRVEKITLVLWGHSNDSVRFGHLRCNLGEVLGAGHANG